MNDIAILDSEFAKQGASSDSGQAVAIDIPAFVCVWDSPNLFRKLVWILQNFVERFFVDGELGFAFLLKNQNIKELEV